MENDNFWNEPMTVEEIGKIAKQLLPSRATMFASEHLQLSDVEIEGAIGDKMMMNYEAKMTGLKTWMQRNPTSNNAARLLQLANEARIDIGLRRKIDVSYELRSQLTKLSKSFTETDWTFFSSGYLGLSSADITNKGHRVEGTSIKFRIGIIKAWSNEHADPTVTGHSSNIAQATDIDSVDALPTGTHKSEKCVNGSRQNFLDIVQRAQEEGDGCFESVDVVRDIFIEHQKVLQVEKQNQKKVVNPSSDVGDKVQQKTNNMNVREKSEPVVHKQTDVKPVGVGDSIVQQYKLQQQSQMRKDLSNLPQNRVYPIARAASHTSLYTPDYSWVKGEAKLSGLMQHIGHASLTPVGVAVLDTGLDRTYGCPQFMDNDCIVAEENIIGDDAHDCDPAAHGTYITEIIIRFAPFVKLYIVKVLNRNKELVADAIIKGLEYVEQTAGIDIVNMSFCGAVQSKAYRTLITQLGASKVLLAASGGDSGGVEGGSCYPADNSTVIAVGAHDNNHRMCSFSAGKHKTRIYCPGYGLHNSFTSSSTSGSSAVHDAGHNQRDEVDARAADDESENAQRRYTHAGPSRSSNLSSDAPNMPVNRAMGRSVSSSSSVSSTSSAASNNSVLCGTSFATAHASAIAAWSLIIAEYLDKTQPIAGDETRREMLCCSEKMHTLLQCLTSSGADDLPCIDPMKALDLDKYTAALNSAIGHHEPAPTPRLLESHV